MLREQQLVWNRLHFLGNRLHFFVKLLNRRYITVCGMMPRFPAGVIEAAPAVQPRHCIKNIPHIFTMHGIYNILCLTNTFSEIITESFIKKYTFIPRKQIFKTFLWQQTFNVISFRSFCRIVIMI